MATTFDISSSPPQYAHGLPSEIHIWKTGHGQVFILRDTTKEDGIPTWFMWREGQAIKDVGADYSFTVK